jgi:hypothetical protein
MLKKLLFILFFIFTNTVINANTCGTVSGIFLDFYPSARSRALGGAVSALSQNTDALHFNTASAIINPFTAFSFSHQEMYQGLKYNYYSYLTNFSDRVACGISIKTFSTGYIDKTRVVPGTFFQYTNEGSFKQNDIALTYGMAYLVDKKIVLFNSLFDFSIGGNIKIINSSIDIYEAIGYTTDWSLFFSEENFNLSVSISNLFGKLKYVQVEEKLPLSVRLGMNIPFTLGRTFMQFGVDWTKISGDNNYFNVGFESELFKDFVLRNGFNSRNEAGSGFAFGFGWTTGKELDLIESVTVNYSYSYYGDLGDVNSFDFIIIF